MDRPNLLDLVTFLPDHVDVEVFGVRNADGGPLTVRCLKPDQREMAIAMRSLGGARPAAVPEDADPEDPDNLKFLELAPRLVEPWVAVRNAAGEWQAPAFSFADPPAEGLIPASKLSFRDLQTLTVNLMELGGYLGGAAGNGFLGQ